MGSRSGSTRDRLQRCAIELFVQKGYDATTVNEIAVAAGVSHMTFFRYFPSKEAVVCTDPFDPLLARSVAAQPADLPPVDRVRLGLLEAVAGMPEPDDATTRARVRLVAGHPALRAAMWEGNQATEEAIAGALVSTGVDPLAAKVVVGACLGAVTAALFDWGLHDGGESLLTRICFALDQLAGGR